jgi:hypothetical protein
MRRLLWLLAILIVLLLVLLTVKPSSPGVSWRNFERIQVGMDVSGVEAILGGPGEPNLLPGGWCVYAGNTRTWYGREERIIVRLDFQGRIEDKWYVDDARFPPSLRFLCRVLFW